jgi:hypothetical protein
LVLAFLLPVTLLLPLFLFILDVPIPVPILVLVLVLVLLVLLVLVLIAFLVVLVLVLIHTAADTARTLGVWLPHARLHSAPGIVCTLDLVFVLVDEQLTDLLIWRIVHPAHKREIGVLAIR